MLVALLSAAPTADVPVVDFSLPAPAVRAHAVDGHIRYEYRSASSAPDAVVELMAPRPCPFDGDVCGDAYARAVALSVGGHIDPVRSLDRGHGRTLARYKVVPRNGEQVGLYETVVIVQDG
ncbi:MAG: hypothetical protein JST54_15190 [Deltaproteobacteria bacterium]|nr:hypothetical protein [Deltaproteobacteria bacterium]